VLTIFVIFIRSLMHMNIRPLHDRVVIRRKAEETTSPGGIVLPDAATEKPVQGEVIAVGNGKVTDSGEVRPLDVKVGDIVMFGKFSGTEVKIGGEEVLVMREEDIMGVIEG
jgi:chaperonin GroES